MTDRVPVAHGVGLPWDVAVEDGVAAIAAARGRHGDTFVVASGADHYLFTFSPTGVESFYALPEETASKGLADYRDGGGPAANRCCAARSPTRSS